MSIYEEFNEIKTHEDYERVKNTLAKNLEMRKEQEIKLKDLGLGEKQIMLALLAIDRSIDCGQTSVAQWECNNN